MTTGARLLLQSHGCAGHASSAHNACIGTVSHCLGVSFRFSSVLYPLPSPIIGVYHLTGIHSGVTPVGYASNSTAMLILVSFLFSAA
eukprot:COSAG06_NODE_9300_length_1933_cov_1.755180_2_plen_87_part_00